jgi:hypothetical protein
MTELVTDDYVPSEAWLPDNTTYALDDPSGSLYDTELLNDRIDFSLGDSTLGKKRKRVVKKERSQLSVG